MVGGWSYRKGCDLIIEAIREMNCHFLHVGSLVDMDFPDEDKFTHVSPVDQKELITYYSHAKVLVLPSREEGMSLVQMQAIACGLPIVCSAHTGGYDIGKITGMTNWIFEMEEYSVKVLKKEIGKALAFSQTCNPKSLCLKELSWAAYGKRYGDFLRRTMKLNRK